MIMILWGSHRTTQVSILSWSDCCHTPDWYHLKIGGNLLSAEWVMVHAGNFVINKQHETTTTTEHWERDFCIKRGFQFNATDSACCRLNGHRCTSLHHSTLLLQYGEHNRDVRLMILILNKFFFSHPPSTPLLSPVGEINYGNLYHHKISSGHKKFEQGDHKI